MRLRGIRRTGEVQTAGLSNHCELDCRADRRAEAVPPSAASVDPLRIGVVVDGLREHTTTAGDTRIANGGVGVYIHNLVRSLLEIDHTNQYFLLRCGPGRLQLYADPRAETVFLPWSTRTRFGRWLDLPYRRPVQRLKLDVLHHPNQFGGLFLPRSVNQVMTLHDISPLLFPHLHRWRTVVRYRMLLRYSLSRARAVITVSSSTRRDLTRRGLANPDSTVVVPNGVSTAFQSRQLTPRFLQRYDLPERFVLFVGVMEPRKNVHMLCEALRRLHAAGEKVGLVLVGRSGWKWNDPRTDPSLASVGRWIRVFTDVPQEDLPEFYARAEAFAYPSFHEGFGLPVLEAMSCGTPVVASNIPPLAELTDGAALLADHHDVDAFVAVLRRVLNDPVLRSRMASSGVVRSRQYTWRKTAQATLSVYRRAAGRSVPEPVVNGVERALASG